MKRLLLVLAMLLSASPLVGQVSVICPYPAAEANPADDEPAYQWLAIADSIHRGQYCNVAKGVWDVTQVQLDGNGHAIITTATPNDMVTTGGGYVRIHDLTADPAFLNGNMFPVVSATSTTITVNAGGGPSTTAMTGKIEGVTDVGFDNTVTLSIANLVGSETFQFQSPDENTDSGAFSSSPTLSTTPLFFLKVGPTEGNCVRNVDGSGVQSFDSTVKFDVVATSNQDPSKHDALHFLVCADTPVVYAKPGISEAWLNDEEPIHADVVGQSEKAVDWTIYAHPDYTGCTAGTIEHADLPLAVFHTGSCVGRYKLKAASHKHPGSFDYLIKEVINKPFPSWGNNPPEKARPEPCEIPADMADHVYEIGPGFAYTDPTTLPLNSNYPAGSIFRFHNTDTTGTNPTTWKAYIQFWNPSTTASVDTPAFIACNVPDANGVSPVFDGQDANGAAWVNGYTGAGAGIVTTSGNSNPTQYTGALMHLNHFAMTGFHVKNAQIDNTYHPPGDPSTSYSYGHGSACMREWADQNGYFGGNHVENCTQGFFNDFNAQNAGWGGFTGDDMFAGNYLEKMGTTWQTEHTMYIQGWRLLAFGNYTPGFKDGGAGNAFFSSRSASIIALYNRVDPDNNTDHRNGASITGISEVQDSGNFLDMRYFYGPAFAGNTCDGYGFPGCSPSDTLGINGLAGLQEDHNVTGIIMGNVFRSWNGGKPFEYTTTHATINQINPMQIYWAYNTFKLEGSNDYANAITLFEWQRATYPAVPVQFNWGYIANNIMALPANNPPPYGYSYVWNQYANSLETMQSNLANAAWGYISDPLNTTTNDVYVYNNGFNTKRDASDWGDVNPVSKHIGGYSSANFLTYTTEPINDSTMKTPSGSAAAGQATAMVGVAALYPPLWNAVDQNGVITRRTDGGTTIGAYEVADAPTPVSIAVTPNPIAIYTGQSITLTCTTTMSDSTTRSCFAPSCTSSNTTSANMSGLVMTATIVPGTGNIACTAESLTAPADAFTVTTAPPATPSTSFGIGQSFGIGGTLP